jgi:SAM-dependent MidA family methyltransferase
MRRALYGPDGFFTRPGPGPAAHFRTSAHASPIFAGALAHLLATVDTALGHPDPVEVVDVGAGRGELLMALRAAAPEPLRDRLRLTAVELAPRPTGLPAAIAWVDRVPRGTAGLLLATEWLDNVPLDVAVGGGAAGAPPRYLHVSGRPGGPVCDADRHWLRTWWPESGVEGARAEIGRPRDEAWAAAVSTLRRGVAVAVDYGHLRATRPVFGTLAGYRGGRRVVPVPDGSCDVTAHVAMDAVAAAGAAAAGGAATLITQRAALRALGVEARRPPIDRARTDPTGYVRELARSAAAAELLDPDGLGAHWWLIQPVGQVVIPTVFSAP